MGDYKVALVNPVNRLQPTDYYGLSENIEIAYIASYLRAAGVHVEIIDAHNHSMTASEVAENTADNGFGLVITWGLLSTLPYTFELAEEIKNRSGKIFIATGGRHTTFAAREALEDCAGLDAVFLGEGELTAGELAKTLEEGRDPALIKGLASLTDKHGFLSSTREELADLNSLPMPARDSFKSIIAASTSSVRPTLIVQMSRGCYGACSFCCDAIYPTGGAGRSWRARSPENVIKELETLTSIADVRYPMVYFADSNFIGQNESQAKKAFDLAKLLIASKDINLRFEIKARVDSFTRPYSDELVAALKEAGLRSVLLGIEAGSDHDLGVYQKGIHREDIEKAMELMNKHRIDTCSSGFITFNPYQSIGDAKANIELERDLGQATLWNIGRSVELLPGCSLVDKLSADNLLNPARRYDDIFGYKFRDQRVGRACKALDFYDTQTRLLEDATVRIGAHLISQLEDAYEKMTGYITPEIEDAVTQYRDGYAKERNKLNELNASFALDTLENIDDITEEAAEHRKKEHVDNIEAQLKNINHSLKGLTRANVDAAHYATNKKDGVHKG